MGNFRWTKEAKGYKALLEMRGDRTADDVWGDILPILEANAKDWRPSERAMYLTARKKVFAQTCFFMGLETGVKA